VTESNAGPFGSFRYTYASDSWWWSDQVYRIHGFGPGDVVPTSHLMLTHKHPDDRAAAANLFVLAHATGQEFCLWHRVVDASRRVREVLSVGGGVRHEDGVLAEIRGYMVDLTEAKRRVTARDVDDAVRASAQSRAAIEQAKGALMLIYHTDESHAFELLRDYSQLGNVKVRDVAGVIAAAVARDGALPTAMRAHWDQATSESERSTTGEP
jgi:hypothetical protein